ncbi:MAG: sigma 54-interacting transcriptional regulator [Candidatus Sumerlaeia bacterium]|nr:sigma 54-interacting transcriptional regulator [Candidatus Sumerlaeia bacterium]
MPQFDTLLYDLVQALLHHRDLKAFFDATSVAFRRLWDVDAMGMARYLPETRQFETVVVSTGLENFGKTVGYRADVKDGSPADFLLRHRRVLLVRDVASMRETDGVDMRHWECEPVRSGMAALLERGDAVIGYLFVAHREENRFGEEDARLLERIAPILAVALENAVAFEELESLRRRAELEGEYLREEIGEQFPVDGMVGRSPEWRALLTQIRSVAPTQSTVLISGETGTGKELVARAIHERSPRARAPFIKVNCGALTETLIESELFGHERGAFTGAHQRRLGRFELAERGTLFLDEIGELPLASQVKLLRVLEAREIERVGGTSTIPIDVRLVAATNRDLQEEVDRKAFRADLFYRLNVFPIRMPALRQRGEDIPLLAHYFLQMHRARHGRPQMGFSQESLRAILEYPWPGNVRELEHVIERAVILTGGQVIDLRPHLLAVKKRALHTRPGDSAEAAESVAPRTEVPASDRTPLPTPQEFAEGGRSLRDSFAEAEREAIRAALAACRGVVGGPKGAAARLGLKRQTLQSKLKKHELEPADFRAGARRPALR